MATIWWQQLVLVMCGGALGAAGRFWLGGALLRRLGEGVPWGTLAANLIGSFAIGFLAVWLEGRGPQALYWRAFLIVGLLGGLKGIMRSAHDRELYCDVHLTICGAVGIS